MDDALKEALRLRKSGFAIHWLRPTSKVPIAEGWAQARVMDEKALCASYRSGLNVGFRPGRWSVVEGGEICVLDIDIRGGPPYQEEAYAAAKSMLGSMYRPEVISGSGVGRHQYLRFPIGGSPAKAATTLRQSDVWIDDTGHYCAPGTPHARPAWLIEILSTGKNVVLPPSIHPDTNQPYAWAE